MANECIPLYDDGDNITLVASVAVTGKKFVDIATTGFDATTNCLSAVLPTAAGKVFGVASFDAPIGGLFNAIRTGATVVVPVTAGATVTAGQQLQVDATGAVIPLASGVVVARALTGATSGNDVFVTLTD